MNSEKKANKFSFGLGLFLCFIFGIELLTSKSDIKETVGFLIGVYNVWQHGFERDTSKWKIKPIYMVIFVFVLFFVWIMLLKKLKTDNSSERDERMNVMEQLAHAYDDLPVSIGNNDSIISIKAVNDHTLLETKYKINTSIQDFDSSSRHKFNQATRVLLLKKIKSINPSERKILRRNRINFKHIYLDSNLQFITKLDINYSEY